MITLIAGLMRYKALNVPLRALVYLAGISFLSDSISYLLAQKGNNNWLIINLYTLIECSLLIYFYYHLFTSPRLRVFCLIILAGYWVFTLIQGIPHGFRQQIAPSELTAEALGILTFALLLFYQMLQNPTPHNILNDPIFWANSAMLFYFSASLFLFIFSSFILLSKSINMLWMLHNGIYAAKNILIIIAFWKSSTQT